MEAQKIFVIEDDENIRELIKVALDGYGYETAVFETAEAALACIETQRPALAIFDLMLPGMDGLSAIRRIRGMKRVADLPILVLTAKDKEYDKVVGLDGGADDYMTKPFGIMELAARVRSLLRRSKRLPETDGEKLRFGDLTVDTATREVLVGESRIVLTYKEYELLLYLIENRARVVPREELLDKLWDYTADIETRTLDIHIRTLRQKLGAEKSAYIRTVRSVGYRFCAPEQENV